MQEIKFQSLRKSKYFPRGACPWILKSYIVYPISWFLHLSLAIYLPT